MRRGEELKIDEAINEIASLLAAAYERSARIRLVRETPEIPPSTKELDKTAETSVHEVTLTRRREEPTEA